MRSDHHLHGQRVREFGVELEEHGLDEGIQGGERGHGDFLQAAARLHVKACGMFVELARRARYRIET